MQIINDTKLDFDDVLLRPHRSTLKSREDVDLIREIHFKYSKHVFKGVPIMAANMDHTGTLEMAKSLNTENMPVAIHKYYSEENIKDFYFENPNMFKNNHNILSSGITSNDWKRVEKILENVPFKYLCLDVANGYQENFEKFISRIRNKYSDIVIIAGNVCTSDMTQQLIMAGADIVKVGIGGGSTCITRMMTGVGYPQLSAIIECADAAHGLDGRIIADGGCRTPADIVKAFGAGADFVMLGGMLAGHDECSGKIIEKDGKKFKEFYGMSSYTAQEKHGGLEKKYRASEGKKVEVPYRGPVLNTVKEILGGLRSACTYVGARRLKDLSKCATFIKVSNKQQLNNTFGEYEWKGNKID